jgi:MFS transporter, CP family, cyanate transporter
LLRSATGAHVANLIALLTASLTLRSVMNGLPPVLGEVRHDLGLGYLLTGALISLPLLCLSAGSIPGAWLVSRFGSRSVMGIAIAVIAAGAFWRLFPPVPINIYVGMAALSLAAAAAQPAASDLVRTWFPAALQRAATLQASAVSLGGLCGTALTGLMAVALGWRQTFVIWGLVALIAALAWWPLTPRTNPTPQPENRRLRSLARQRITWIMVGISASQAISYYTAVTWIPVVYQAKPVPEIALILTLINIGTFPPTLLIALLRRQVVDRSVYYIVAGALGLVSSGGLLLAPAAAAGCALLLGVSIGMAFTGSMALPAVMAKNDGDVPGYAALMLTLGYAISVVGPLSAGLLLDLGGHLNPLWPVMVSAGVLVGLGMLLPRANRQSDQAQTVGSG